MHKNLGSVGRSILLLSVSMSLTLGCAKPRIVTIKFPGVDPTTDYVVCDARGESCRGRLETDVPPTAYRPELDVLVPTGKIEGACPFGPRTIEVVVKKNRVVVVGYECAAGASPPPLPEGAAEASLTGGLPEEPVVPDEEAPAPGAEAASP